MPGDSESSSTSGFPLRRERVDYGSAAAYCAQVRKWVFDTQCWNAFHQQQMMSIFTQQMPLSLLQQQQPNISQGYDDRLHGPGTIIQQPDGRTTWTGVRRQSSFVRRVLAELIDFAIMFVFKIIAVWFLYSDTDMERIGDLLGEKADFQSFIDVTQEFFPIEMILKVVASFLEAWYISYGLFDIPPGCTPGKYSLRQRVISCEHITGVTGAPQLMQVTGSVRIPFKNALARSLLKNLIVNTFFPLSTILYAFTFNRSICDIMANTIVVYN